MELLIPLMLVIGALFFARLLFRFFGQQSRWNRSYLRVGQRYNGKQPNGGVTQGVLFSKPNLTFIYAGCPCQVRSRRSRIFSDRVATQLRIQLQAPLEELEITTGEFQRSRYRRNDGGRLEFEDPQFQSVFNVAAKNKVVASRLLTSTVRWQLEQLRRLTDNPQLSVAIGRGVMTVSKPGFLCEFQPLDDFVRLGLQLHDQMQLAVADGIDFLNDDIAAVVDHVKCPICSEEITEQMVVCARCKTPHCQDCWQYNGQCATFACNETRFVKVG